MVRYIAPYKKQRMERYIASYRILKGGMIAFFREDVKGCGGGNPDGDFGVEGTGSGGLYSVGMAAKAKKAKKKAGARWPKEVREAMEYGIDVCALEANLKRTVAERIRRHQIALDAVEKMRKAKRV